MPASTDPTKRRLPPQLAALLAVAARFVAILFAAAIFASACGGDERTITLATTTSTENSGLLDVLVPAFEEESGYHVKVVPAGSGAALVMGERGDADVLLVHSPLAEEAFVRAGYGVDRTLIMTNDFVIVGPPDDPAGVRDAADAAGAFARIAAEGARFISRGDDSGTHAKERALWGEAGLAVPLEARWYVEAGQGMGATLTIAAETGGYTLSDRGTWLVVSDREALPALFEGGPDLLNVYHLIAVNPERHPGVNVDGARRLRDFLVSPRAQELIGDFGRDASGAALFVPAAE